MALTSMYPVLQSADVAAAAAFFRTHFAFETTFEADWYVSLRRGDRELAILDAGHSTVPSGYRQPAGGVLINFEVDDVDAEYRRLVIDGGLEPVLELTSEDFGQRHFLVAGPDGVLVDVITPIAPSAEFLARYS